MNEPDKVMTTIRKIRREVSTEIEMSFGKDPHYNIKIAVQPDSIEDRTEDGVEISNAAIWFGGLRPPHDDDPEMEITAWRTFNEIELRELAKNLLIAAGTLRRLENSRRRKLEKKRAVT